MKLEKLLEKLPEDKEEAIELLCNNFFDIDKDHDSKLPFPNKYDTYLEHFAFLVAMAEKYSFELMSAEDLTGNEKEDLEMIEKCFESELYFIHSGRAENKLDQLSNSFKAKMGVGFHYSFNESEVSRIQNLINELRSIFVNSKELENNHKSCLLKRLEGLQRELHKLMSDLDKFWGLVGDAGVVLGKFGKDSKPIVDRIREITEIIWRVQSKTEGLPDNSPNLLNNDEDT